MLQDDTISEDQLTSAASHELEQEIEAELEQKTEAEPEKEQFMELEIRGSGGGRRSGSISKPVNKFDPSPTPKTPRKPRRKPEFEFTYSSEVHRKQDLGTMSSIAQTVQPVLNEAWVKRPLGPPRRQRSTSKESRTSIRTRAASLEKLGHGYIIVWIYHSQGLMYFLGGVS